jgi:hypothetical protein
MITPQGSAMTSVSRCDLLIAAPSHEDRMAILERFKATRAHLPRQRPTMPTFDWRPRKALTELRPRHLHMVEEYGFRRDYDRNALGGYFRANWYRLFGALRKSKALEVPSDQLRKELMVSRLLDLIEGRRAEYADERSEKSSPAGCTPGLMMATGESDTLSRRFTFQEAE